MPRSTTTSTTKMTRMRLTPREKPRLPETTTCQDRPRSPLSSEPEVSTSSLPNARRSCSYSVSVKSTTVSLSVLTVPLSTWSEQSSHLSLTDTHPVIMSAVWFTSVVTEKWTAQEFLWLTTPLLMELLDNMESHALRIWFTKFGPLDHTSSRQTTSSGQSSSTLQNLDGKRRDIHSTMEVSGATVKNWSMKSFPACSECVIILTTLLNTRQASKERLFFRMIYILVWWR